MTKNNVLAYRGSYHLEVIGYRNSNFVGFMYKKVYIWLRGVSFRRMSNFMEKCEAVSHCCINGRN